MNLFVIPSWYPSGSNPSYGIFIKEQIDMMGVLRPDWKIGVSTWGQGAPEKLLWSKDHFKNLNKVTAHRKDQSASFVSKNITTYYQPALSWTKKIKKGNLKEIIRCNELNYRSFWEDVGRPDLISVQAGYPGALIGSYLSSKYSIPYHVHLRLGGFMFEALLKDLGGLREAFISSIRNASLITATSDFQKKSLTRWFADLQVLYNPVDTDFFISSSDSSKEIVSIGRLEKEKGFDMLIESVSSLNDLQLNILGTGSELVALKRKVEFLDLGQKIHFHGEASRSIVRDHLSKSSFLVLPSRYETFGNVLLETMACGRPVVATKCGGPEEIVTDNTGILCDPTVKGIEEGIQKMIHNRYNYHPEIMRKEVEERFGKENWMNRLEGLFKEIA